MKPEKKPRPPRAPKYRNNPVYITPAGEFVGGGHPGPKKKVFDSLKEYRRWLLLRQWQAAGLIQDLRTHRNFPLHAQGGEKMTWYEADFTYVQGGRLVVEDVKSRMTRKLRMYKLKRKWMKAEYGITIVEV